MGSSSSTRPLPLAWHSTGPAADLRAAPAQDQAFEFHAIEEPGHSRSALDQPAGYGQGRNSIRAGAAQNPQDVILLMA